MQFRPIFIFLILTNAACTYPGSGSDHSQWSGAQREEAMGREKRDATDERMNNQLPRPRTQIDQQPF